MSRLLTLTVVIIASCFFPLIWSGPADDVDQLGNNSTQTAEDGCPCGEECRNNTDGAFTCAVDLKSEKPICIVACCLPGFCGKNCTMPGGHCCADLKIPSKCDDLDYSQITEWDFDPDEFEDFQ